MNKFSSFKQWLTQDNIPVSIKQISACTRKEAKCLGSLANKYLYEDGTEDEGILLNLCYVTGRSGATIGWTEYLDGTLDGDVNAFPASYSL